MAAKAGERAERTGTFHCEKCGNTVRAEKGERIPACPKCGNTTYGSRTSEKD